MGCCEPFHFHKILEISLITEQALGCTVLRSSDDNVQHSEAMVLWTSSFANYPRKYFSETESVSVHKSGEKTPTLLGPLIRGKPFNLSRPFSGTKQAKCLPPHLRTEAEPVSETLRSLASGIPGNGRNP
jgi:hypothetical protein